jgi:DNA-binding PadR family transcriptional regulator
MNEPETFLPITSAAFHILLALAKGERHGYAIMQDVTASTAGKLRLGPGTLYGTIKRLLADGLIIEAGDRPDAALTDERRRYYRLSDLGLRVASAEAERLERLVGIARERRLLGGSGGV